MKKPHQPYDTAWKQILDICFKADKMDGLEASGNLFALIVLCHLEAARAKSEDKNAWLHTKIILTERLYAKKFSEKATVAFYNFIDYHLHLPRRLELQYKEVVYEIEETKNMAYISSIERLGIEQGFKRGRKQGREEGLQEGRQEGRQEGQQKGRKEGEYKILLNQLKLKFRLVPQRYQNLLKQADEKELLRLSKHILTAASLKELFGG